MNISYLLNALKTKISASLPGEISHKKMLPEGRTLEINTVKTKTLRLSSVLVLLYENNNDIFVLLIQRQEYNGYHSGQISFPGGKTEASDPDRIYTALRETYEEVGIDSSLIKIIGPLSELYIPPSNFLVLPIVGFIESLSVLNPDQREVKEIFSVSLNELCNPGVIRMKEFNVSENMKISAPCYIIGERVIWGATAMILSELLDVYKSLDIQS